MMMMFNFYEDSKPLGSTVSLSETGEVIATEQAPPIQDLCHKCGRCCKSATTFHNHEKVLALAAEGNFDAQEFLRVFKPYPSIEAARAVVPEQVAQVLEVVTHRNDMDENNVTFYYCEHVTPEGLCGIYETRPRCCKEAPAHGWSVMPPGCGFEGWQFLDRERQKRMIRDLKSQVALLSAASPDGIHHPSRPELSLEELHATMAEKIKPWQRFGADYW